MDSKHKLCLPGLEVKKFLNISLPFNNHIMTGDPEVCCSRSNIFRDINGAGEQDLHMGIERPGYETPFTVLRKVEPAFLHEVHDGSCDPSLIGDREPYDIGKRRGVTGFLWRFCRFCHCSIRTS